MFVTWTCELASLFATCATYRSRRSRRPANCGQYASKPMPNSPTLSGAGAFMNAVLGKHFSSPLSIVRCGWPRQAMRAAAHRMFCIAKIPSSTDPYRGKSFIERAQRRKFATRQFARDAAETVSADALIQSVSHRENLGTGCDSQLTH